MAKPTLYPLKFTPILKSPLWGGTRLASHLNKDLGGRDICGESWEISGVAGNVSVVAAGPLRERTLVELIEAYASALVGQSCYDKYGTNFPLLIKFIDANQDLSIQVHPNDELAKRRHNSFGKTEMWYVIDAEAGASLISGFNRPTSKEEYRHFFEEGRLMELLNKEEVEADDVFFLPAGRVHTIGKGLLIAEIQQTSDITYRIFDFDRVDKDGNKRELHIEEAVDAIDYQFYPEYKTPYDKAAEETALVASEYFVTRRLKISKPVLRDYRTIDSFKIIMVLSGMGKIDEQRYATGDTFLIPANMDTLTIKPESETKILEVYLPA